MILEFIVWLVSGTKGLDEFNEKIVDHLRRKSHYFEDGPDGKVKVHSEVLATMEALSKNPQCRWAETALGDLLKVVRTRLLVVGLEEKDPGGETANDNGANTRGQSRADSTGLRTELDSIIRLGNENPAYWLEGESIDDLPGLCVPQTVTSEPDPQSSLTVARDGSVGGQVTTGSSSLFVSILTGSVRVG